MKMKLGHLDTGSIIVAAITLALFLGALVAKGLGHDVMLEAGVFLISVKLLMMVHKDGVTAGEIKGQLAQSAAALERIEAKLENFRRPDR